jgi:spore cortex biosynthesis protein YabQ
MTAMVGSGIYIGMAVDTFNRIHLRKKRTGFFRYLNEILFWVLQGLILFYVLFLINQGEFRFYIWLAVIFGFVLYQSLLKEMYIKLLEYIIRYVVSFFRFLQKLFINLIIAPLKWLFEIVTYLLTLFWTIVIWIAILPWKIVRRPTLFIGKWLLSFIPENAKKYLRSLPDIYSKIKDRIVKWWEIVFAKRR